MKLDYSPRFEDVAETLNRLYKAYQDGFIMEDEKVLGKWLASMLELIVEMGSVRNAVALQYYHEKLEDELSEKETAERIREIEEELNN